MEQFLFTFFNAEIAARYWPDILRGMGVTVLLSLAVIGAGLLLGLLLAVLRATGKRGLVFMVVAFADVMRALPPLILIIVLFGSRKLPDAARSLGKSMRILKTEVQGLHDDEPETTTTATAQASPAQLQAPAAPDAQAQIDALSKQLSDLQQSVTVNKTDSAQA